MRFILALSVVTSLAISATSFGCPGGGGGGTSTGASTGVTSLGITSGVSTNTAMVSPAVQQAYLQQAYSQQLAYQQYLQQQSLQLQLAQQQLAQERAKFQAEQAEQKAIARAELMDTIRESKIARRQEKRAVLIAKREARERGLDSPASLRTVLASNQ